MPEWCDSYLDVSGDAELVADFRTRVRGSDDFGPTDLSLATLLPVPDLDTQEERVDWRLRYWGCKWEPEVLGVEETVWGLRYHIRTPNSPPHVWAQVVSGMIPGLTLRLASVAPDMHLASLARFAGGDAHDVVVIQDDDLGAWQAKAGPALDAAQAAGLLTSA